MVPTPAHRSGGEIRLEAASKSYGRVDAMREVTLQVAAGSFMVLLGPSGSGKTTLARCLAGVERLDSGSIRMGGEVVADSSHHLPPEKRDLAMVFQDFALWPHLTVEDNVRYALRRRRLTRDDARRRTLEVLAQVDMERYCDRYPYQLSGGEQQRVALARAVVAKPRLLLFDEPLSNLDAHLRERLRVEISTLARESGATVVYITHDQAEAFALADEIAVLRSGKLVQVGSPEAIYQRPRDLFVAGFTGLAGRLNGEVVRTLDGEAVVRMGQEEIRARLSSPAAPGSAVTLAVRPAAVRVLTARARQAASTLEVMVRDVAYRGRGYEHVVDSPAGRLSGVLDQRRWPRGTRLRVALDLDGCMAFASDAVSP